MLKLVSKVRIENKDTKKIWKFSALNSCVITKSIKTLTDTCELKLPRNMEWQGYTNENGKPPIKRGDKIQVQLGYDDKLITRFVGYVRSVDNKTPLTIKCEDEMFLLKQVKAEPKAFRNASLNELIEHLLKGTSIDFKLMDDSIKIGNWRITKPTVSQELQELKEKVMLYSYFREMDEKQVLYVGLVYPVDRRNKLKFEYSKNIISEEFEYGNKKDVKIKVEAISFDKKNKKTCVLGDEDGEVIKIRIDGLTESELKKHVEKTINKHKQTGFKGKFKTFGVPEVSKCDLVEVVTSNGNKGVYLVKENAIEFGMNGYRQDIELGTKVS